MSRLTRRTRAVLAATASVAIAGALAPGAATAITPQAPPAQPTVEFAPMALDDLIISEYVEGSGNNKAIEIFNGTDAAVDLAAESYVLRLYSNGSDTPSFSIALTGTVESGGVYVVANSQQAGIPQMVINQLSGSLSHNGNDSYVLVKGDPGTTIDSFGQVGFDPGASWGTTPTITVNATLRRLPSICSGDTVTNDEFDPAAEWSGFPIDTFSGLGSHVADCGPSEPQTPVINEFSIDTAGPEIDFEFYEVYGEPETDYSDLSILQVEGDGSSGSRGSIISADQVGSTDADGFWHVDLPANRVQNGTLTLLLATGYTGQTVIDADRDGVIDEDIGLTVVDSVAILDGNVDDLIYSETALDDGFDGEAFAPGGASRIPDATDTDTAADWVRNDFNKAGFPGFDAVIPTAGQAWNTPGAPNEVYEEEPPPPGGECGDEATLIGAVQGSGDATPMSGQIVTVEGVVVGDFQTGGFDGYFVQDAGDGDATTSDGVFVYAPGGEDVAVGDKVRVTGTATEFNGKTQLTSPSYQLCASDVTLPEATELAFPLTDTDYEAVEGMFVTFPDSLSILEYFNYARYGEVTVGTGLSTARQFQPTAVAAPDSAEAVAVRDYNASHQILVDDGLSPQNPPYLRHPAGGQFTLEYTFRGGDTLTNLSGVLDYSFNLYRIQPTQDADFEAVNPRPVEAPATAGATMTVASFNVLNYFTDFAGRGADNQEEFDRQEVKIVAALAELDADVVGLIEIENNNDVAVQTLTDALNDVVGADTYDYVPTGTIGTDEITTAFIYKPANVSSVGDFATLTTADDPRFLDSKNRPTLAQTFEEIATGEQVTVAVNHLKSKGSSCDDVNDPEDPWAANCNGVRTDAAEAMVDWLAGDPTGTGAENTLVIGDLNAYDKEDPINVFLDDGYSDLLLEHQGEYEYSYVFDGQLGYLDYALANEALAGKVTAAEAWKINADEPSILDYDTSFKPDEQDALFEPNAFRSSDHDPILVGLALAGTAPEPVVIDRTFGNNRYATSAAIAEQFGDVGVAYLASGEVFPDALTGTAPAVRDGAPVLLTRPGALPQSALTALDTLQPEHVFVLGGPDTISDAVLVEVEAATGATVLRIAGDDRYGTASELALERFTAAEVDTVYVAAGEEFADSLAGGPLAGIEDDPILLTGTGALPQATVDALVALDPARVVVLGGPDWIPDTTLTELGAYADSVDRVAGDDRYETAALIAGRIGSSDAAFVASGVVFPDALSGAAWAGHESSPLLLTRTETLPQATAATLVDRAPARVTLFGGPVTITDAVRTAIEELFAQ
ncbi:ExeM/NucH family extracellular endonuclease [Ornithinimicrobium cryptoxanthini]|uniref:ExeM/NucH family extracellular endonuclease n=1 Tax=Ornithinimicrobium cryptoxanthini TaxID=2934161 RepID=A0ABY4YES0_9MICO|nr:ExeM/NucH family extracellular endonuclease [Ornithinimicrobium cryptoxanthini]USQ75281.1 ExeM/NucH family extracellular endonuclease [Ornithinimicrobium cryptoxanthini]